MRCARPFDDFLGELGLACSSGQLTGALLRRRIVTRTPPLDATICAGKILTWARLSKAPIATEAGKRINVLFTIERETNVVAPWERLCVRQEHSQPLIVELEAWLCEQRANLSRNNVTTKAINYRLSRWNASTRFLDDERLCVSNNGAEREPRAVAVRRKKLDVRRGPMRAAGVGLPSTTSSPPPSSTTSIHRLGLLARLPDHPAKCINELPAIDLTTVKESGYSMRCQDAGANHLARDLSSIISDNRFQNLRSRT